MLASAILLGLAAGLLTGGRLGNLAKFRIRGLALLVLGSLLRVVAYAADLPVFPYVVALACFAAVAFMNRGTPGAAIICVGIVANLVVVVANGGMPVSADALVQAGASMPPDNLHIGLTSETRLAFLADVIPAGVVRAVYSVGDFVLALGGFRMSFGVLRSR